jgi:hypothetical protein
MNPAGSTAKPPISPAISNIIATRSVASGRSNWLTVSRRIG